MSQIYIKLMSDQDLPDDNQHKDFKLLVIDGNAVIDFKQDPIPTVTVNGEVYPVLGNVYVMNSHGEVIETFTPKSSDCEIEEPEGPFTSNPIFDHHAMVAYLSGDRWLITGPEGTFIADKLEIEGAPLLPRYYRDLAGQVSILDLMFNETETVGQAFGAVFEIQLFGNIDLYVRNLTYVPMNAIGIIPDTNEIVHNVNGQSWSGKALIGADYGKSGFNLVYLPDNDQGYVYQALNSDQLTLSVVDHNRSPFERVFANGKPKDVVGI